MIYTRDHPPAHVHVWHQGHETIIEFQDEITTRDRGNGFTNRNLMAALEIVESNKQGFLIEWRKIHEQI